MGDESAVGEPWALRRSFLVVLAGAGAAVVAFVVAYGLEGGNEFGPRFEVGLRAATAVAAITAGLLTWARLELSRREHHLAASAEQHRFDAEQQRLAEVAADQRLAVDRDLTERFGRSVEQLGGPDQLVRVGGVFALERFALDALDTAARRGEQRDVDWRMALDLLAAFARERGGDHLRLATAAGTSEPPDLHGRAPVPGDGGGRAADIQAATPTSTAGHDGRAAGQGATAVDVVEAVRVLGRFIERSGWTAEFPHDLTGVRLAGATLGSIRLAGTTLVGADADGVDLTGACLRECRLVGASLAGARLAEVDLTNADLRGARLPGADLRAANLTGANLTGADLAGARLTDAHLRQAKLGTVSITSDRLSDTRVYQEKVPVPERTADAPDAPHGALDHDDANQANLANADLTGADLTEAESRGALFEDAQLTGAILTGADLRGAKLSRATLTRADLSHADLRRADLTGAQLVDCVLASANLRWANLRAADLREADLSFAYFTQANLVHADLTKATLQGTRLAEANLRGAKLVDVVLVDVNLRKANLTDGNLRGASLADCNLRRAILVGANLTDTTFERVDLTKADITDAVVTRTRWPRIRDQAPEPQGPNPTATPEE